MNPKRTLRGKRHIRARATVRAGREKKKIRKMMRTFKQINFALTRFVDSLILPAISKAAFNLGIAIRQTGEAMAALYKSTQKE